MDTHNKQRLLVLLLTVMVFSLLACKSAAEKEQDRFDNTKTMSENIDILNSILEKQFGRHFVLLTTAEYEESGPSDWVLLLEKERAGVDIATWKYDYELDSEDGRYMEAILTAFLFFYGEEMGEALWELTGDLNDGGADESIYGFTHEGSQAIYKDSRTATYQLGSYDNFYLWLEP